ncbi:MAG: hypothetical protein AAGG68_10565 [Bacteroidota bacterium]
MQNRNILDHLDWEEQQQRPELYSKKIIMTFTLFFSVLVGMIFYLYNLWKLGKWQAGIWVVLGAVAYHYLTVGNPYFVVPFFVKALLNFVASLIIALPVWNWQIGKDLNYKIKSPVVPLFLAILFVAFLLYSKGLTNTLLSGF